jgi:hypothetical protein
VLFDEGHETRDLGLVILSSGAVDDLDLHPVLRSVQYSRRFGETRWRWPETPCPP